jgi:mannose-6-phosphate isomerase
VTLLLNRLQLQPGEALFLGPGNLHAYLNGVGVEVMGASDNVVRGGLTDKPVDVDELLRILQFEVLSDPVLSPVEVRPGQWRYPTPDAPFELWRFDVGASISHSARTRELLLCTEGDSGALHRGEAAYLSPGESVTFTRASTVFCVTESS